MDEEISPIVNIINARMVGLLFICIANLLFFFGVFYQMFFIFGFVCLVFGLLFLFKPALLIAFKGLFSRRVKFVVVKDKPSEEQEDDSITPVLKDTPKTKKKGLFVKLKKEEPKEEVQEEKVYRIGRKPIKPLFDLEE